MKRTPHTKPRNRKPRSEVKPKSGAWKIRALLSIVAVLLIGVFIAVFVTKTAPEQSPIQITSQKQTAKSPQKPPPNTWEELTKLSSNELAAQDIARVNLICALGLPGSEGVDLKTNLTTLSQMAEHIQRETERHQYRFDKDPAEFENSKGKYRIMMMVTVLQQDFRLHYNTERIWQEGTENEPNEVFFANSADIFIHGLIKHAGMGTCSSMPVLFAAIGRRLGYPIRLVKTKAHLYARWDGDGETFNIECTSLGFVSHNDEHYRAWPMPFSTVEEQSEGYLKSMNPDEEFSVFCQIRGACLQANQKHQESITAFTEAYRRFPQSRGNLHMLQRANRLYAATTPEGRANLRLTALNQISIPNHPSYSAAQSTKTRLSLMIGSGASEFEIEAEMAALNAELYSARNRR